MKYFEEIHTNAVKAEEELRTVKKNLLAAAKTLYRIQCRALAIAQASVSPSDREQMTTQFVRDMLNLQTPDGVSLKEVMGE